MPLNIWLRILTTLSSEKNGSVDVTFTRASTHQKHLAQSGLIEKSIISRSAKDTALGSMIELTVGFYGRHKRKNNGIVHDFQTHLNLPFSFNWPAVNLDY